MSIFVDVKSLSNDTIIKLNKDLIVKPITG